MDNKQYKDRHADKKERLKRGELECERLKWVSADDRQYLVDAGVLDEDDKNDPDAVIAAWDRIWNVIRENIRQRSSRKNLPSVST